MSSFIENNDMQREPRFVVYEQANITTDCTVREAAPTPSLKIPFPPPINPEDLVKKNGEVPSRSPNAFLIYRRVVVKELQAQNYAYKMTDVSSMASASWKSEPEHVKQAYLEIAGVAKNMLTNTRHKTLSFSRRRRAQNNSNNNNTRNQKSKTSSSQQQKQQPRKKQINTTNIPQTQTPQPFIPEPKHQFIQPLTISTNQHIIQNIIEEDRPLFSPSFAISMDDVDSYLFTTDSRDFIWTQSSVSDVLAYSDGESSSSTDESIFNPPKMTKLSYSRFMLAWHFQHLQHLQLFYGDISPIIINNELDTMNVNDQLH